MSPSGDDRALDDRALGDDAVFGRDDHRRGARDGGAVRVEAHGAKGHISTRGRPSDDAGAVAAGSRSAAVYKRSGLGERRAFAAVAGRTAHAAASPRARSTVRPGSCWLRQLAAPRIVPVRTKTRPLRIDAAPDWHPHAAAARYCQHLEQLAGTNGQPTRIAL